MNVNRWIGAAVAAGAMVVLAACGGGDDTAAPATVIVTTTASVSTVTVTASATPTVAVPETTTQTAPPVTAPQVTAVSAGSPCAGYQTGSFAYDASGTQLVCSDYTWQVNVGQRPRTEWGDGQAAWAECLESNTVEQCREQLNR